jgi:hypothetical protein
MNEVKINIAFDWLMTVILSCKDPYHFNCVDILIDLFQRDFKTPEKVDALHMARAERYKYWHGQLR